jgi:terminal uridylyltransferase
VQGINSVEIIEELGRRLRKHRTFYNVLPIVTAKVPIVKFKHRPSQLDGDISLYNTLVTITTSHAEYSLLVLLSRSVS